MIERKYEISEACWRKIKRCCPTAYAYLKQREITTCELVTGPERFRLRFPDVFLAGVAVKGKIVADEFDRQSENSDPCIVLDGHPDK